MSRLSQPSTQGHDSLSRRAVVKGGISAVVVTIAMLKTARLGDAAVTSMDRAPVLQPLSTDATPKTTGTTDR